ncbi:MAG TPA: cobalamin-independent methionine synthase II family protein [Candidatus Binataceae bacterium]|nr:cobalamin-independent methionine synthase II family protein [Candidatus Binataceae bacterium]
MRRSIDRILCSHAGSLPRPSDVRDLVLAREEGGRVEAATLNARLRGAIEEVVRQQVQCGIDVVNDGEFSKGNFTNYVRLRMAGVEQREVETPTNRGITIYARDAQEFPEYFERGAGRGRGFGALHSVCVGPLRYIGQEGVAADVANFKAALMTAGADVSDAFLPSVAPGTIEHWLLNEHYPSQEAFLTAIAEAMREEYRAIVEGGFILQIDDPDLPDAWQMHPEMDVATYRKFARLRVDALNHALRDLPEDRVRFHTCWGSYHGPHKYDIALCEIVDLILAVRAQCYSIEGSNPRHEHEWRVWESVKLPEGKILMPGVVGHCSDFIEHPELVAERLVRLAKVVGRENLIAGTDCGLGHRVGDPKICWAKFEAMAQGARLASRQLWNQ